MESSIDGGLSLREPKLPPSLLGGAYICRVSDYWVDRSGKCFSMELYDSAPERTCAAPAAQGTPRASAVSHCSGARTAFPSPSGRRMFCSLFDPTLPLVLAVGLPLLLAIAFGDRMVAWLERRFRAPLKTDSETLARLQAAKHATPTMGGLFILAGITALACAGGRLERSEPLAGIARDHRLRHDRRRRRPGQTTAGQPGPACLAEIPGATGRRCGRRRSAGPRRQTPLAIEAWLPDSGVLAPWLLTAWATLVILSSSNAVNLADGLDGLAGGTVAIAATCLGLVAWLAADHTLQTTNVCLLAGGMVGSLLGFLRFNRHPARVFMGDTGSLPLGALLGLMALATGHELLWMVIGGVFVAEAISVMLQVGWFKWRDERLFRCAPLHHHFQFQGWPERKIVARFWLASFICAATALALVKLPVHAESSTDTHSTAHVATASGTR